jgi:hypothetical protein
MIVDNIDLYSSSKLSKIIQERFGQSVNLSELEDHTLDTFKTSVESSIKSFESAMAFNTQASNPKYLENKLLHDAIVKEQEMRVKRVQGDEIEIEDPKKPGVTTKIDTKQVDIDQDPQGNVEIKAKNNSNNNTKQSVKVGQKVTMEDLDDEARNFVDYIQNQGYTMDSMGAGAKGITIQYTTRDGDTHTVDFKDGKVTREDKDEGDLEDVVAPEFKKLVHDMQKGMSKAELEKKYPKQKDSIEQLAGDLAKVVEAIRHAISGQVSEAPIRLGAKEMAALRLLVGAENFSNAKRALELAKSGRSVPAPLMKGFMPVIEKLDTFIKGGASAVTRFNNLQKIVGRNESNDYASSLRSLLENEMETSEILLASQDIVDQITDMYEKVAEIKSSAVLELVDRMSDEMGQEQAESYQNQIGPALEALEQALATARQGAQDSVAIVKGEAPQPMAGDGDIDTGMDLDTGDKMSGDADIEGGDDFGASEPAAGGDEPVGRAER